MKKKLVLNIVSSNVTNDPRVMRAYSLSEKESFGMVIIGRKDPKSIENKLDDSDIIYIDVQKKRNNLIGKIFERLTFIFKLLQAAKKIDFDIIHANDFDMLIPGILLKYIKKKPIVYDAHEIYTENSFIARTKYFKKIAQFIENLLLKKVDKFITVSNVASQFYLEKYNKKNIVVSNMPEAIEEFNSKQKVFTVLSHGIFVPDRGYEELINVNNILERDDIQINLRGYGPFEKELKRLSKDSTIFKGAVSLSDVVKEASSAHVGVVLTKPISTNYKLSVSNKLFEYINAGIPIIMSDIPEHRYLNEKYKFGIILNEISEEELIRAIILLKDNKNYYDALKTNVLKAASHLNWEVEGRKLLNVYEELFKK